MKAQAAKSLAKKRKTGAGSRTAATKKTARNTTSKQNESEARRSEIQRELQKRISQMKTGTQSQTHRGVKGTVQNPKAAERRRQENLAAEEPW